VTLLKKQQGYHTKCDKQKQCHTSNIKYRYPDPSTTRIWPGRDGWVPGSGILPNSLPVPL